MTSHKGKILIASRRLGDPNFDQTLIFLVQHEESGALGLVLNRPLDITVAEAVSAEVPAAAGVETPIHEGGPCPGPLMVLFKSEGPGDLVTTGVRFSAERDVIENLMSDEDATVKYFANYSGWGRGQLENEIEEGAWIIIPATSDDVFNSDPKQWKRLTTRATVGRWINTDHLPDDPSLN